MVVWISKEALTQFVYSVDVETVSGSPNIVRNEDTGQLYYKPEWHETKTEAIAEADKIREKAICREKIRLGRLEKLLGT